MIKLFNKFRADSDEHQGMFVSSRAEVAISISSMLKKAHRPDGQRLNISIWSADYKLEPGKHKNSPSELILMYN